jgi:hypothetical protein
MATRDLIGSCCPVLSQINKLVWPAPMGIGVHTEEGLLGTQAIALASGLINHTVSVWFHNHPLRKSLLALYSCSLNSACKTDYDIALVIYNQFKQDFVCSSLKQISWCEYKNHR